MYITITVDGTDSVIKQLIDRRVFARLTEPRCSPNMLAVLQIELWRR